MNEKFRKATIEMLKQIVKNKDNKLVRQNDNRSLKKEKYILVEAPTNKKLSSNDDGYKVVFSVCISKDSKNYGLISINNGKDVSFVDTTFVNWIERVIDKRNNDNIKQNDAATLDFLSKYTGNNK